MSVSLLHYFCCSLNVTDSFSFSAVVHQDKSGNKENLPCCLGDGVCLQYMISLGWCLSEIIPPGLEKAVEHRLFFHTVLGALTMNADFVPRTFIKFC